MSLVQKVRRQVKRPAVRLAAAALAGAAVTGLALAGWRDVALGATVALVTVALVAVLRMTGAVTALQADTREALDDLRTLTELTQRRVVNAVEKERLAAADRHRDLVAAVSSDRVAADEAVGEAVARSGKNLAHGTDRLLRAQSREFEALLQLFRGFEPRAPMPSSGDFALNPTDLLDLLHLVRHRRPKLVLELGSGTSSVWLAYALEAHGGRLVSVDHDPQYAAKTRAALAAHGLDGVAEVRDAPLQPVTVDGTTYRWYDRAAFADLSDVDLLLVDGPPEATGPGARYPALPTLEHRLADTATVILDDANRRHESEALRRWTETVAGLAREPELLGRHAVLSYVRPVATVPA